MSRAELRIMTREGRKAAAEIIIRAGMGEELEFFDRHGDVTTMPDYFSTVRVKDHTQTSKPVGVPALMLTLHPYRLACNYEVIYGNNLADEKWDVSKLEITTTVALLVSADIINSF